MEHIALMEHTFEVKMPIYFTRGREARSFFTREGILRWPEKSPSQSSCDYVQRQPRLRDLVKVSDPAFRQLVYGLLELDPRSRLACGEAIRLNFIRTEAL